MKTTENSENSWLVLYIISNKPQFCQLTVEELNLPQYVCVTIGSLTCLLLVYDNSYENSNNDIVLTQQKICFLLFFFFFTAEVHLHLICSLFHVVMSSCRWACVTVCPSPVWALQTYSNLKRKNSAILKHKELIKMMGCIQYSIIMFSHTCP